MRKARPPSGDTSDATCVEAPVAAAGGRKDVPGTRRVGCKDPCCTGARHCWRAGGLDDNANRARLYKPRHCHRSVRGDCAPTGQGRALQACHLIKGIGGSLLSPCARVRGFTRPPPAAPGTRQERAVSGAPGDVGTTAPAGDAWACCSAVKCSMRVCQPACQCWVDDRMCTQYGKTEARGTSWWWWLGRRRRLAAAMRAPPPAATPCLHPAALPRYSQVLGTALC
jgi:hypothetical protein